MNLLKHDIASEFAEYKDKIHSMKMNNAHFAKLFESYDTLNRMIAKIEMGGGAALSDESMEMDKKKRLKFKDEICQMLTQP